MLTLFVIKSANAWDFYHEYDLVLILKRRGVSIIPLLSQSQVILTLHGVNYRLRPAQVCKGCKIVLPVLFKDVIPLEIVLYLLPHLSGPPWITAM